MMDTKPDVVGEIRRLYFKATAATILNDFDRAIDLLKTIETEADRERATVYMEGLAEMAREWGGAGSGKVEKLKSGKVRRKRRKTEGPKR
jgi:hypothetical protein